MLIIFNLNDIYLEVYYSILSTCQINRILHNKRQRKSSFWYMDLDWHIVSLYFLRKADLQYDWVKIKMFYLLVLASKTWGLHQNCVATLPEKRYRDIYFVRRYNILLSLSLSLSLSSVYLILPPFRNFILNNKQIWKWKKYCKGGHKK